MADISSITLPGGGTYDLKDKNAVPKYGMGKNLLRNWYFVGGGTGRGVLPVNQRGFTTSSNVNHVWSIDGWWINGGRGTQTLNANGFYLNNSTTSGNTTMQQWIGTGAEYEGKVMTLSALSDVGLVVSTFTVPEKTSSDVAVVRPYFSDRCSVAFYALSTLQPGYVIQFIVSANSSITIKAVKLELGTEQTLAHQENGIWVLNEIPDYEAELIKCQTYTIENSDTLTNKSLATEQQLATVETGITASKGYDVGECFCWNGLLYRAKTQINSGAPFTVGTNCFADTFGSAITLATINITTNATGQYNTGTLVETKKILAGFADSCQVQVYTSPSRSQVLYLTNAATSTPAANKNVDVTLVILNY